MQVALAWIFLKSATFVILLFLKQKLFISVSCLQRMPWCFFVCYFVQIIQVKSNTYRIISNLSYSESYRLLKSSSLSDKFGILWMTKNRHRLNKIKYSKLVISSFSLFSQISMPIWIANSRFRSIAILFDHEDNYIWRIRPNHCN